MDTKTYLKGTGWFYTQGENKLINDFLVSRIGQEVSVKLTIKNECNEMVEIPLDIIIGNYREGNKIYLDIPTVIYRKYSELSQYPYRMGINNFPLKEGYCRIMMGMGLAYDKFSFGVDRDFIDEFDENK